MNTFTQLKTPENTREDSLIIITMKSVIKKEDAIYYVEESDFIMFVEKNSNYSWNKLCDLCKTDVFNDDGRTYFTEKPMSEDYKEFAVEWIGAFYDAHPFMKRIMFVS